MKIIDNLKFKIVTALMKKEATTMTEVMMRHTKIKHYCPHCGKEVKLYSFIDEDNSNALKTIETYD